MPSNVSNISISILFVVEPPICLKTAGIFSARHGDRAPVDAPADLSIHNMSHGAW